MSKPVICFDFDGTLVDKSGRIHPRDVEILRGEDRVVFIPATGRPLSSVRHAFEQNGLNFEAAIPFPMILQNGAVVYLPHEELLAQTPFPAEQQAEILSISQRHTQVCCLLFSLSKLEIRWPNQYAQAMIDRFDLSVQSFETADHSFTKITFISEEPEAMKPLVEEIMAMPMPVEASFSLPTVFELTPMGIDKGQMLSNLLAQMGLADSCVVVAGDGENDLPLFAEADISLCPHDSPEMIKSRVDSQINVAETGLLTPMLAYVGIE